ncbi:tryptophan 7-halogenase [Pseudoalteromonas citrea]|uniref:Tryptophan 7-halogenase n=1 Tax=Pseudoalteromonas citrea TaxID=43655 RepID=A0A5S3XUE4_9GAMM|nr:tryptophan halogenase family protein [Pseudoalteromonas citrea]TMP43350.1 tryptophan 7-halogenase [Pseudoalteromonas citrea]TMP62251.1 tryptophan 7-halogenase [Pseudoalteromonas citrea]
MQNIIKKILIVGGGTAGWLTAARLAKHFKDLAVSPIEVCLVESANIPTIGVGEGTWPTIRDTLKALEISETEFINSCEATFKQGAKFVNWKHEPTDGQDTYYHHLFTSLYDPWDFNLAPYWSKGVAGDVSYAEAVSMQSEVCEAGLAPKSISTAQYEGLQGYAYHLDAAKFAALLQEKAVNNFGVRHIIADIDHVSVGDEGAIEHVVTSEGLTLEADLFIDCSGFKSMLLGNALNVPFIDLSDTLFVNRAVALQVPYENEQAPVACETISTAQSEGWIWDIGLQSRRGMGFVYCDKYLTQEEAEKRLRKYAGQDTSKIVAKHLSFQVGYREKFWHKNCVAIGLSAAFVEPLEASAIFLVEAAVNMLCDKFPHSRSEFNFIEKQFNDSFSFRWNKTIEFIKMHYVLSNRNDGPFWQDNKREQSIPLGLQEKLNHWRTNPLSKYDFSHAFEPFVMDSYQYVLYGMGFKTDLSRYHFSDKHLKKAEDMFSAVTKYKPIVHQKLPTHRELLNKLKEYSFPKV